MRAVDIKCEDIQHYNAAEKALKEGPLKEENVIDYFRGLMLEGRIQEFMQRTGLKRNEIAFVCNKKSGKMFLQWKGAVPPEMETR